MSNDFLMSIVDETLSENIKKLIEKGNTQEEIEEKIDNTLSSVIEKATKDLLEYITNKTLEIYASRKASEAIFIANQESKWGKCFAVSDTMYMLAIEAAKNYAKHVQKHVDECKKEKFKYTFLCLQHIHGRACQEFLEILYLMKLGFPDGAYARWRSMYELSCVGYFIRQQGEQIAKQYFEQSQTEAKNYEWAKGAKKRNGEIPTKWNFADIQNECDREEWKNQYRLGCFVNHASPQGTFKRLANGKTLNIIPVGQSDYGIITPAEHSAISLAWITNIYLNIFTYTDGIVYCNVINALVDIVREKYFTTHKELFKDIEEE